MNKNDKIDFGIDRNFINIDTLGDENRASILIDANALDYLLTQSRGGDKSSTKALFDASMNSNDLYFIQRVMRHALLNGNQADTLVSLHSRLYQQYTAGKCSSDNIYDEVIDFIDQNIEPDIGDECRIKDYKTFHLVLVILDRFSGIKNAIARIAEIFKKQLPEMNKILAIDITKLNDIQLAKEINYIANGDLRVIELEREIEIYQNQIRNQQDVIKIKQDELNKLNKMNQKD